MNLTRRIRTAAYIALVAAGIGLVAACTTSRLEGPYSLTSTQIQQIANAPSEEVTFQTNPVYTDRITFNASNLYIKTPYGTIWMTDGLGDQSEFNNKPDSLVMHDNFGLRFHALFGENTVDNLYGERYRREIGNLIEDYVHKLELLLSGEIKGEIDFTVRTPDEFLKEEPRWANLLGVTRDSIENVVDMTAKTDGGLYIHAQDVSRNAIGTERLLVITPADRARLLIKEWGLGRGGITIDIWDNTGVMQEHIGTLVQDAYNTYQRRLNTK